MNQLLKDFEFNAPVNIETIHFFENNIGIKLPQCYCDFLIIGNGGEGPVGDFGYAMFWKVEELLNLNQEYNVKEYLEDYLVIGSDGGGEAFAINLKSDSAKYVQVPFVGMCEEDCIEMGGDFTSFLEKLSEEQPCRVDNASLLPALPGLLIIVWPQLF